jgi:hypothetical protein
LQQQEQRVPGFVRVHGWNVSSNSECRTLCGGSIRINFLFQRHANCSAGRQQLVVTVVAIVGLALVNPP